MPGNVAGQHDPVAGAYVGVEEIATALRETDGWTIEVHETRDRPTGAATHHASDVVLRDKKRDQTARAS